MGEILQPHVAQTLELRVGFQSECLDNPLCCGKRRGDDMKKKPPDKSVQIRCPRLGHQIHFSYCRTENSGLPCFKTIDCWSTRFPVETCLREELAREEWEEAFERKPKPKVLSLVELIEQAKKRKKEAE
jgi:hypothetical protein